MTRSPSTTAFAKTTRPEIARIVAREALFAQLDGPSSRTVAWITGPAGSGKSTLAASYVGARNYRVAWYQVDRDDAQVETFFHFLAHAARRLGVAPERLPVYGAAAAPDLEAFSRAFFRRLFAEAGSGAALVIDNLDLPEEGAALRRCIENGLAQVPRHCAILVTSRSEPPPALARLRANGEMVCVGAQALRISLQELAAIAQLRGWPLAAPDLLLLHERTQGWAAAIVLMLEHARLTGAVATLPVDAAPQVLFDYLAGEIFDRFEAASRDVLLRIACLPRVTAEVAVAMSGDPGAARLLLNLSHNDYFVREVVATEHRVYVLHPLYREFLLRLAGRELPQALAPAALVRGARLLHQAGLPEDAVPLLVQAGDWPGVAAIVLEQADALLAEGRRSTLAAWLEQLPPASIENDARLLCVDAASRLADSPRAARLRFERSAHLCRERGDAAGLLSACSGVVQAMVAEFDDLALLDAWLPELAGLIEAAAAAAAPARPTRSARPVQPARSELTSLMTARWLRDPGDAACAHWCRLTAGAAFGDTAPADRCALMLRRLAALLRGDLTMADALAVACGAGEAGTPMHEAMPLLDAFHQWFDGNVEAAARTLADLDAGLAGAAAPGRLRVQRTLLQAAVALAREDVSACGEALARLDGSALRRGDQALLHTLRAAWAALRRESALALREARGALQSATEVGLPWAEALARLLLAQALAAVGDRSAAEAQGLAVEALAGRLDSAPLGCSAALLRAALALDAGDEALATAALRRGLVGLRDLGARQVLGLLPNALASLLAQALRLGVEVEYAQQIVRHLGLRPPPQALRLRRWPWRFELCSLGGFELLREGRPIEFSAKGPGRPLELLKLLVAFGARHVRIDELTDALWPHVDGDYAYKSFTATLHRLRRLLGDDEAVLLREGRLSLNLALFWVDACAFDQLLAEIDAAHDARLSPARLQLLAGELVTLYRGPFLPDEAGQAAYLARREQLRARLLRALALAWPAAPGRADGPAEVDAYLRCIQADELCEGLHRELMQVHLRRGEVSCAAAVFERLRGLLATRLRTLPSPQTQAIHDVCIVGGLPPPA